MLLPLLLLLQARVAARLAEHQAQARAAADEAALREQLTAQTRTQLDAKLGLAIRWVHTAQLLHIHVLLCHPGSSLCRLHVCCFTFMSKWGERAHRRMLGKRAGMSL